MLLCCSTLLSDDPTRQPRANKNKRHLRHLPLPRNAWTKARRSSRADSSCLVHDDLPIVSDLHRAQQSAGKCNAFGRGNFRVNVRQLRSAVQSISPNRDVLQRAESYRSKLRPSGPLRHRQPEPGQDVVSNQVRKNPSLSVSKLLSKWPMRGFVKTIIAGCLLLMVCSVFGGEERPPQVWDFDSITPTPSPTPSPEEFTSGGIRCSGQDDDAVERA